MEQTREKVGRSFATVLKLMEEYPNYKFMSSQPQLYAFLKERYPELYAKAKERIEEKRWEPEGGMWLEADCNLTSGESLVRQFMHGKRFFKEEFGVDNRILWLPDVFGYSGALPQIMKKCGIDYFMTTKLAWNQFNKIPYDTMRWRGIDGSEVLTHLITTLGVSQPIKDFFTTYNGMLHPDAIMGGWMRYQNKDINNDILISYGYGDSGGGPTREMLETSLRIEPGTIHAIGAGNLIAEIQQNSNVTYRVPILKRKSFEPHIVSCDYFTVDKIVLDGQFVKRIFGETDKTSFASLLVLDGEGEVRAGEEQVTFGKGDSVLITADTGEYELEGSFEALLTTV